MQFWSLSLFQSLTMFDPDT